MINEIRLNNFKCFVDKTITFNKMTVIAGANATGKSSIIQSILLQEEAYLRKQEKMVDKISMMGFPIGSLKGLIAHERNDLPQGDMRILIKHNDLIDDVVYTLNKGSQITLITDIKNTITNNRDKIVFLQSERMGSRVTYPASGEDYFMPDGGNAPFIMSNANNNGRKVNDNLAIVGVEASIEKQFEGWISAVLGETHISIDTDPVKASTDIKYMNRVADDWVYPPMTGFGLSYVESIIVAGLWCSIEKNRILIVENPEAHLHPSAQSMLGRFLLLVAVSGVQVIIETHSEHIIDGIRYQAASMKKTDDVTGLFLKISEHNKEVNIENIRVRSNGELDKWPSGFFDQKTLDLRDLFVLKH